MPSASPGTIRQVASFLSSASLPAATTAVNTAPSRWRTERSVRPGVVTRRDLN